MPIKKNKNHTALEDRAALEDKTKFPRETIKQIFLANFSKQPKT